MDDVEADRSGAWAEGLRSLSDVAEARHAAEFEKATGVSLRGMGGLAAQAYALRNSWRALVGRYRDCAGAGEDIATNAMYDLASDFDHDVDALSDTVVGCLAATKGGRSSEGLHDDLVSMSRCLATAKMHSSAVLREIGDALSDGDAFAPADSLDEAMDVVSNASMTSVPAIGSLGRRVAADYAETLSDICGTDPDELAHVTGDALSGAWLDLQRAYDAYQAGRQLDSDELRKAAARAVRAAGAADRMAAAALEAAERSADAPSGFVDALGQLADMTPDALEAAQDASKKARS